MMTAAAGLGNTGKTDIGGLVRQAAETRHNFNAARKELGLSEPSKTPITSRVATAVSVARTLIPHVVETAASALPFWARFMISCVADLVATSVMSYFGYETQEDAEATESQQDVEDDDVDADADAVHDVAESEQDEGDESVDKNPLPRQTNEVGHKVRRAETDRPIPREVRPMPVLPEQKVCGELWHAQTPEPEQSVPEQPYYPMQREEYAPAMPAYGVDQRQEAGIEQYGNTAARPVSHPAHPRSYAPQAQYAPSYYAPPPAPFYGSDGYMGMTTPYYAPEVQPDYGCAYGMVAPCYSPYALAWPMAVGYIAISYPPVLMPLSVYPYPVRPYYCW